jgi:cyclopropane fatty-acyl-phospholipid synthase-like methyltransferase
MAFDGTSTRTTGTRVDLDYAATRAFFDARAGRADGPCPWTATMYQDTTPELAAARDRCEKERVLPLLRLHSAARVLDVGCGVGRWAVSIAPRVATYHGVDFSEGLLEQARLICAETPGAEHALFTRCDAQDVGQLEGGYDRIVLAGILAYLNDDDARRCLEGVAAVASPDAIVYLREPMGVGARLTLDRHWSDDLEADYSAIYRTVSEYRDLLDLTLAPAGLHLQAIGDLYPPELDNRSETRQRIIVLGPEPSE